MQKQREGARGREGVGGERGKVGAAGDGEGVEKRAGRALPGARPKTKTGREACERRNNEEEPGPATTRSPTNTHTNVLRDAGPVPGA